ncbi:FK506-binding protein 1B, partial [Lachnellula hyalina]
MGVSKTVLSEGSGAAPKVGDTVTIEYTGFIKDTSKPDNKGSQFDSSVGRGAFVVKIGVGKVIKGWDEGVTTMKVGEKATLDITPDYGYGDRYVYNSRVSPSTFTTRLWFPWGNSTQFLPYLRCRAPEDQLDTSFGYTLLFSRNQ